MTYIRLLFLAFLAFPHQTHARKWKTLFPTKKEVSKLDKKYPDKKIIIQNYYYPKEGKFDEVLTLRIKASNLLKKFGLKAGKIIINRQTSDTEEGHLMTAPLIWQAEYSSLNSLEKDLNLFTPKVKKR